MDEKMNDKATDKHFHEMNDGINNISIWLISMWCSNDEVRDGKVYHNCTLTLEYVCI